MSKSISHNTQESNALSISDRDMEAVSDPVHAENWISMCNKSPMLMQKFQGLFVAAQLTMLGNGFQPQFA